jgi:3-deoxy-7-phosphoheptulonate synthase
MDVRDVELVAYYTDIIQIGARNMQNFFLLKECSGLAKPIMLKRGQSATLEEWLLAAEYLLDGGNSQVILCERGIRTFEKYTRNTLDLSAVPALKNISHLPVFVDPSHGTGSGNCDSYGKSCSAAGADGFCRVILSGQRFSDGNNLLLLKSCYYDGRVKKDGCKFLTVYSLSELIIKSSNGSKQGSKTK